MTNLIRSDLIFMKEKLESVEKEFMVKIADMEEKFQLFIDIDEKLDRLIKDKDFNIRLDIGGKVYVVKLSTLARTKDSLFYNLFAKYLMNRQEIPREFFFDRNSTHFNLVIEYLKYQKVALRNYNKIEKEEINEEFNYYGIDLTKKQIEIDIEWDKGLSKEGSCTIDSNDKRILTLHSSTCYTHFVTNRIFDDTNFVIEFDSTVTQNDYYYYIGLFNNNYLTSNSCGCCNPTNAFYIKCDGTIHINGINTTSNLAWNSNPCVIGMRVLLNEKQIYFYKDSPENEVGPYDLNGTGFRPYAGHCNSGNGTLTIKTCHEI